mgnify:CR=1 FL=1
MFGVSSTVACASPALVARWMLGMLSMDTILMFWPGFSPASLIAWIAPTDILSLSAYGAQISAPPSAFGKLSITTSPCVRVKSPVWLRTIARLGASLMP